MLSRFFNSQAKSITFGAALLGLSALLSRLFGLLRVGVIADYFGRGEAADIYFAAFRLPDFVYNILIAGGIIIAFLPLFSEYYAKNREKAWQFTNYTLNVFLFLLILLSLAFFIFARPLITLIAPGFSSQAKTTTIALSRLMFLSPIFFGLASVFSGVLHYFNRFLVYSIAPILYNVSIILGILLLSPRFGIFGAGLGVAAGAFLYLVIQIPGAIKCGFRYQPLFNFKAEGIKRIFRLMLPRLFAVAAQQINLTIITAIASTITTGAIAIFTYANDMHYFPIGVIGIPFALASFPSLSRHWAEGQREKFFQDFSSVFRQILFLIIPAALGIFIFRIQLVRLVLGSFGQGQFDWLATRLTAVSLGIFALGIFASALAPLISRAFFAMHNTKTPTLVAVMSVILNIILSFAFVGLLGENGSWCLRNFLTQTLNINNNANLAVLGLPLAFSLAAIFQFILLLVLFHKKTGGPPLKEIWRSTKQIILAAFLMGLASYGLLQLLSGFLDTRTVLGVIVQTLSAGLSGIFLYLLVTFLLKSPEMKIIWRALLNQFKTRGCRV